MKRALIAFLFASSSLLSPVVTPVASAMPQEAIQVNNCSKNLSTVCIKSISSKQGAKSSYTPATLTGKSLSVDRISNGGLRLKGAIEEYETPGNSYEPQGNNRITASVEFFPAVTAPCLQSYCPPAREVIGVFLAPSLIDIPWQSRLVTSPFRTDSKFCGTSTNPELCSRNFLFNEKTSFKIVLQIPSDYVVSFIHGIASDFSYDVSPSTVAGTSLLTFELSSVNHAGMLSNTWGTNSNNEDGADYMLDSTALWFFGKNDMWAKSIGACSGKGAYGVVNNAVIMAEPRWSSSDQSLSVNLQSPHVDTDNKPISGYFSAFVSREMADCLWGVDISKKTSASVAITYGEGGKVSLLTAASSYKGDIFTLVTSGFHYSAPTIKVKLKSEVPASQPAASPVPKNQVKNKTITCIKGSKTQKISGTNPTCPKGYKKK